MTDDSFEDLIPADPPAIDLPEPEAKPRSVASLTAKVNLLSERLRQQESTTARISSAVERLESLLSDFTRRTAPMLETLSAELARHGATLETVKAEADQSGESNAARVTEFEQRLSSVMREMRELIAGKIEAWDLQLADRLSVIGQEQSDTLATFEERVEDLVRRYAAESIPDEMRVTVDELRSRFVHAETALAATRSSVEFLRGEVGGLTMLVKKLTPGVTDPAAGA